MPQGGQDGFGSLGASTVAVVMEQLDQTGGAQSQRVMWVGTVQQQGRQAVAVERVGFDDRGGRRQVGVRPAELLDVRDGAGPEAVDLGQELPAGEAQLVADLCVTAHQFAQLRGVVCQQVGRMAQTVGQAGGDRGHGRAVAGALADRRLVLTFLGQQRIEPAVGHRTGSGGLHGGLVVLGDQPGPRFMIDAGVLVAEHSGRETPRGQERIHRGGEVPKADRVAADFLGRNQLDQPAIVVIAAEPMHVLADVGCVLIWGRGEWGACGRISGWRATMKHTREQKRAALLAQVQALIEEFLDWEEQAERPNLTQIEDVALDLRARFGQELAATALADQDAKQPAEAPACPTCGETMRYKGQKGLDAESRLGLLEIARGYYYCARCHSGLFPPGPPA